MTSGGEHFTGIDLLRELAPEFLARVGMLHMPEILSESDQASPEQVPLATPAALSGRGHPWGYCHTYPSLTAAECDALHGVLIVPADPTKPPFYSYDTPHDLVTIYPDDHGFNQPERRS